MSKKIVIKKIKKKVFIVVQDRHKTIDFLGVLDEKNKIKFLNEEKLNLYIRSGVFLSNTILSLLKKFQLENIKLY